MRVDVVRNVVDFGVYRDPTITVGAVLVQIMEAENTRRIRRHI